jgi:23S rRNA pseudouridine2605 synthase
VSERLHKVLAARGVASRRGAEALIAAGRVTVNGETATIGDRVEPDDAIAVDGVDVPASAGPIYLALNKPAGVVSTTRTRAGESTVLDLLSGGPRVYPVGRLDKESTGLLLLSNDGEWANLVMHPRHGVEKEYDVLVRGRPGKEAVKSMRRGVEIAPGVLTAPARVEVRGKDAGTTRLSVTVMEGKKRQIRLMTAAVGHPALALRRVRIGAIRLGDLPEGCWRALERGEVESIREHARHTRRESAPPATEDRD